ncbi:hypothetical protein F4821DRAFT_157960 [Hypoxylon rubiginosum]|uniref:Uncharacterized protein n=1 Tax=Hypoxylon rubiginosum TaxID=110542 RepID=A0ACC0DHD7_9PEZI|nr:hypothetical protein F4821DRAFT_157960 [Hypoxylon rubiginosum]
MLRNMSDVALATIICTSIFTVFAILSFSIHVFVCLKIQHKFGLNDFLTLLAFMISLALVGQIIWAVVDEGQGQHMSNVMHNQFELTAKSLLVSEALWAVVNTFIRLAALRQLRKIFGVVNWLEKLFIMLIVVSIMYGIAALLTTVLICRPIPASWDSQVQGTCGNQNVAFVSLEAVGLTVDLAILILPIPSILRLTLSLKKRLLIICVFSASAVIIVVTGLRIAALHRVNTSDFSYDQGYLGLLSTLGTLMSIITCYSIPISIFIRHLREVRQEDIVTTNRTVESFQMDEELGGVGKRVSVDK